MLKYITYAAQPLSILPAVQGYIQGSYGRESLVGGLGCGEMQQLLQNFQHFAVKAPAGRSAGSRWNRHTSCSYGQQDELTCRSREGGRRVLRADQCLGAERGDIV